MQANHKQTEINGSYEIVIFPRVVKWFSLLVVGLLSASFFQSPPINWCCTAFFVALAVTQHFMNCFSIASYWISLGFNGLRYKMLIKIDGGEFITLSHYLSGSHKCTSMFIRYGLFNLALSVSVYCVWLSQPFLFIAAGLRFLFKQPDARSWIN